MLRKDVLSSNRLVNRSRKKPTTWLRLALSSDTQSDVQEEALTFQRPDFGSVARRFGKTGLGQLMFVRATGSWWTVPEKVKKQFFGVHELKIYGGEIKAELVPAC